MTIVRKIKKRCTKRASPRLNKILNWELSIHSPLLYKFVQRLLLIVFIEMMNMAYPVYTLKMLIAKYDGKDLAVIKMELGDEIDMLDEVFSNNIINHDFPLWQLEMYLKYAGELLYFLSTGIIPGIIGKEGMRVFTPIIEKLIEKGELDRTSLDILTEDTHNS